MRIAFLRCWSIFAAMLFVVAIGGTIFFLLYNALPQLSLQMVFGDTNIFDVLFHNAPVWDALWPAIAGTGLLLLVTMSFVLPLGITTAVYLSEYASQPLRLLALGLFEIFASIPSIIMGLFGFLLILLLRKTLLPTANTSLLLASFCLALLVLPVFVLTFYTALRGIPHALRVTASLIGLSHNAAVWRVFVPQTSKGLMSAFFLAAGRCVEDTAVILTTGAIANASRAPMLTSKFEALPFYIYYTTANYHDEAEFMRIFAAAFFLLFLACLLLASGHFFQKITFKEWEKNA